MKNIIGPQMITPLVMIMIGCIGLGFSAWAINGSLTVHNVGNLGVVGIYFDSACTLPAQTLNWSTVFPGVTANQTVWLKNFGAQPVTVNLTTANWIPLNASQYMTVSCNHEGLSMSPGIEQASITLTVAANANSSLGISTFSFDIILHETW
jgi:hypothetical protein